MNAQRITQIQDPVIPIVGELLRANPDAISLGQGIVHYPPPPEAMERIAEFGTRDDQHAYKAVQGLPELLQAIKGKLAADNGIALTPDTRAIVTAGSNMAFMNAVLAVTDPGDEVAILSPYYFNHEMAIRVAGCQPLVVPTDASHQPDPERIRTALSPRTRAVVTVSPNNPTGAVYPEAVLREINRLCADAGVYHIHDEAYEYFVYDGAVHYSPASDDGAGEHTISLFSLSKAYGFASWRIGYMVIPRHLEKSVKKIQDTILICPPVISQVAAVGAMSVGAGYCRDKLPGLVRTRRLVLDHLAELGDLCRVPPAQGAFYVLPQIASELDPMDLVRRLVSDFGVAAIPGTTFGVTDACVLRIAYGALEEHTVAEGIGRLVAGLRSLGSTLNN